MSFTPDRLNTKEKIYKTVITLCVVWFIFLCFLHYFSQRALWVDEVYILNNLKNFTPLQLFGDLERKQVFPRVYLFGIKLLSQQFSYHVFSLRLFSLIAMLSAFFVWARVFKNNLSGRRAYVIAIAGFVCSYKMSYYAAELKQYSMDVLVAGLFCLYLTCQKKLVDREPSKKKHDN